MRLQLLSRLAMWYFGSQIPGVGTYYHQYIVEHRPHEPVSLKGRLL